jgi:hypothetical protein
MFKELLKEAQEKTLKIDRMEVKVDRVYDDMVIDMNGQINIPVYKMQSKDAIKIVEAEYKQFIKALEKKLENK